MSNAVARVRRSLHDWAYRGDTPVRRMRQRRMADMLTLTRPPRTARVLDLGGSPMLWSLVPHAFEVTIVNLPGAVGRTDVAGRFTLVEADACELRRLFPDQSFDLAFSNSVIEHVGPSPRQQLFANEVRRLGRSYWVQTPSDRALVEPHRMVPLYWQYKKLFGLEMINPSARVLTRQRMQRLFPEGQLYVERCLGLEKSYALYRPYPQTDDTKPC